MPSAQVRGGSVSVTAMEQKNPRSNLKTGLILASVALLFFLSVILRRVLG
ncbi:MAG TPA: cytochrome oxidase small assembly protein [Burkholderiales bacterium]|nr:cytochrome oxidase small assembly protein [Burkholderiales bacterium]